MTEASSAVRRSPRWSGATPVIEIIDSCGVRAAYLAGMASTLRIYAKPVMSVGVSGGSFAATLLQAGADFDRLVAGLASAPMAEFGSDIGVLEKWMDGELSVLGHRTWADFRWNVAEQPAQLAGWHYRLNLMVTAVHLTPDQGEFFADETVSPLRKLASLVGSRTKPFTARNDFVQMCWPQDVPMLMPWLDVDEMSVAQTVAASCRVPGKFPADLIACPDGSWFALFDGGLLVEPSPFSTVAGPPLPLVQMSVRATVERPIMPSGAREFVTSGLFSALGPLDFERADAEMQRSMFDQGHIDAEADLNERLDTYLASFSGQPSLNLAVHRTIRRAGLSEIVRRQITENSPLAVAMASEAIRRTGRSSRSPVVIRR